MLVLLIVIGVVALLVFKAKGGRRRRDAKRPEASPHLHLPTVTDLPISTRRRRFRGSRGAM